MFFVNNKLVNLDGASKDAKKIKDGMNAITEEFDLDNGGKIVLDWASSRKRLNPEYGRDASKPARKYLIPASESWEPVARIATKDGIEVWRYAEGYQERDGQNVYEPAALVFSGTRALTLKDIEEAFFWIYLFQPLRYTILQKKIRCTSRRRHLTANSSFSYTAERRRAA